MGSFVMDGNLVVSAMIVWWDSFPSFSAAQSGVL